MTETITRTLNSSDGNHHYCPSDGNRHYYLYLGEGTRLYGKRERAYQRRSGP
jgi:hypothetical protein